MASAARKFGAEIADLGPGRRDRRARRPRARRRARGRRGDRGAASSSRTPTPSGRSSVSSASAHLPEEFRRRDRGHQDGRALREGQLRALRGAARPRRCRRTSRRPQRALFTLVPSLEFAERCYDIARSGEIPEELWVDCVVASNVDPSLAPEGRHVMTLLRPVRALPAEARAPGTRTGSSSATGSSRKIGEYAPNVPGVGRRAAGPDAARSRAHLRPDRGQHLPRRPLARAALLHAAGGGLGALPRRRSRASTSAAPARIRAAASRARPGHNAARQVLKDWKRRVGVSATLEPDRRRRRPRRRASWAPRSRSTSRAAGPGGSSSSTRATSLAAAAAARRRSSGCTTAFRPRSTSRSRASRSSATWKDYVGRDGDFRQTGFVRIVPEKELPRLEKNVAMQRAHGVDARVVDRARARRDRARLERGRRSVRGLGAGLRLRRRRGRRDRLPRAGPRDGRRVPLADARDAASGSRAAAWPASRRTAAAVAAPVVVAATGPWSRPLFAAVGFDLPVEGEYHEVAILKNPPGLTEPVPACIDGITTTYFRSEVGGLTLVGDFWGKRGRGSGCLPAVRLDGVAREPRRARQSAACRRSPTPASGAASRASTTSSPDFRPLIGEVPGTRGLYVAARVLGNGLQDLAGRRPVPSRSSSSTDARRTVDISPLRAGSFREGRADQGGVGVRGRGAHRVHLIRNSIRNETLDTKQHGDAREEERHPGTARRRSGPRRRRISAGAREARLGPRRPVHARRSR